MARYIDADALLNKIPDDLPYKASVKRVLIQAPTADVAPKSEVDWNSIPVDVSEALKQRAVEKSKSEVVREIFEEIEKAVAKGFEYGTFFDVQKNIAELKKKYTGEQT
jgi:hypothetical protein